MKKISLIILVLISIVACRKKEHDKIDGPSLQDLNGQFTIINTLQASQDSVDFSVGETVFFTASLSKNTSWQLRISGLSSGAEKIITGLSSSLDASSGLWNGSTSNLPLFRAEQCKVELTFAGEPDTLVVYVKVLQPKTNSGFIVADFENGFNSGWGSFTQSGANMDFQIKTDTSAAEGNDYLNMAGTVNWDWLIGLVNFKASAYGASTLPLPSNPNAVYFNVMIYGEPGLINSIVLFQFQEDDNGDGLFTSTSEDMYSIEIPVNWVGWKLISVKYSDLLCLVNGTASTPAGNGTHNSDKIQQINMLHLANPSSGFAKAKIDYVIFTENGPLIP